MLSQVSDHHLHIGTIFLQGTQNHGGLDEMRIGTDDSVDIHGGDVS